jgi:hypothetical protein
MALCSGPGRTGAGCSNPVLSDGGRCQSCFTRARLAEVAEEANARIESCHERVACPRCGQQVGERCVRMVGGVGFRGGPPLKHPHRERWTLVQPAR